MGLDLEEKTLLAYCRPPTAGGNTWPAFGRELFRFAKRAESETPPNKGVEPLQEIK